MAESDKIKSSDIIQDDIFKNTIDSGKELITVLENLEKQTKENLAAQEKLLKAQGKKVETAEDIEKINASLKASSTERKRLAKLANEKIKLEEKLSSLRTKEFQENTRLKEVNRALALRKKQLVQETTKELGAYKNTSARLQRLRKEYKDLALTQGENTKRSRALLLEITKLDQKLKQVDRAAGQFGRNVGNYPKFLTSATGALKSFVGAFGITAGITGFAQLLRNTVNTFADFEQANVRVASILGATVDETEALQESAKELGATTARSASEVVKLQEAYARLGFTQEQILDLQEATINGSIALNASLGETAELTGAVVNTFDDFSTSDAPEILDVLTLATQKSALNFEKLQTSLPIVAGAANAAGVDFNKLVALLGKLSDAGIDASSSATALRNIFIESAGQGLNYEQILDKIVDSQDKLTAANDEFGKRAAVSASVLSNNIKATNELADVLDNAGGTAERVADQNLDTLNGSITLLSSAWEGFILSIDDGTGSIGGLIRAVVDATTKFLTFLTASRETKEELVEAGISLKDLAKFIGIAVTSFVAYKTTLLATNIATKAYTTATVALRIAKIALTGGVTGLTRAFKLLNITMKANPIGLVIGLLTSAAAALFTFSENTEEATNNTKEFNEETQKQIDKLNELKKLRLEQIDTTNVIRKLTKDYTADLKGFNDAQLEATLNRAVDIKLRAKDIKQQEVAAKIIKRLREELELREIARKKALDGNDKSTKSNFEYVKSIKFITESFKELNETLQKDFGILPEIADIDLPDVTYDEEEVEDNLKTVTEIYQDGLKEIELAGLEAGSSQEAILEKQLQLTQDFLEKQIEFRKAYGEDTIDLELQLANTRKLIAEKELAEQRAIADARIDTLKSINEIGKIIAGENEDAQKAVLIAQKAIATSEILINLQREISDIRAANADKENAGALNTAQIAAATASALAGIATINAQGSFFDGTENTGNGGKVDDRGGFYAVLHPNERVMTAKQNNKVGDLTNNELADIAMMYNQGYLVNPMTDFNIDISDKKVDNTHILASKLDILTNELKNKPVQQVNVDSFGNLVEVVYRNGVKDTTKYKGKDWI